MNACYRPRTALFAAVAVLFGTLTPGCGDHRGHPASGVDQTHKTHDAGRRFADAEHWAARFEKPERDEWQKPEHVLAVLALPTDAKVADIGAATGYFPVRFARAVPQGMVYGVDVEPDMVRYLNERAAREGLTNLKSIVCTADDPRLPEAVDLVFICNTYHHIAERVDYFSRLRKLIRPGGRLVVVDFKKEELPVGPPPAHKLAAETVIEELASAGYALVGRDEALPYQYFLTFQVER